MSMKNAEKIIKKSYNSQSESSLINNPINDFRTSLKCA